MFLRFIAIILTAWIGTWCSAAEPKTEQPAIILQFQPFKKIQSDMNKMALALLDASSAESVGELYSAKRESRQSATLDLFLETAFQSHPASIKATREASPEGRFERRSEEDLGRDVC